MALYKTYQGSFVSRLGHTVRCEIWREASKAPATVGELDFPYESPLTIEWDADSKRETIQGSTATLTVISPGDRTYIDLYTTVAGSVQLRVYRDGALFWSGTLDTEHYEEPFSAAKDYDVTFTFTDFGILDRLKYGLTGKQTIHALVLNAIARSGLYQTTYVRRMSTQIGTSTTTLASIMVDSDNFTDEDGETMTLMETIEGVLKPLELHLRQWNGVINVYDNNAASVMTPTNVTWEDGDQVLGVDEVYNNIKITFSPYVKGDLVKENAYDSRLPVDTSLTNFTTNALTATERGITYTYNTWYVNNLEKNRRNGVWDSDFVGFTLFTLNSETTPIDRGLTYSGLVPVRFECFGNGQTCDALLRYCRRNYHVSASNPLGYGSRWGYNRYPVDFSVPCIKTSKVNVPKKPDTGTYYIRLVLPLMLSAAYNPFTTECQGEAENVRLLTVRAGYVFIPVRLRLYNEAGAVTYHYENHDTLASTAPTLGTTRGRWVQGDYANTAGDAASNAWIAYYATSDRKETNGIDGGWVENRQFCGLSTLEDFESFKSLDGGQYCEMPPVSGALQVEILEGVFIYDWQLDRVLLGDVRPSTKNLYDTITWHAYKQPTLGMVKYLNGKTYDIDSEDIEYSGVLDENAKEELSIDTICGTSVKPVPCARGLYMDANGNQLTMLRRNGRTETVEQLMIGTLHSHYATRHLRLAGTMRLDGSLQQLPVYKDDVLNVPMIVTSAVIDLRADEMEATLIETNQDCYTSI